jgi:hypothetical protein
MYLVDPGYPFEYLLHAHVADSDVAFNYWFSDDQVEFIILIFFQ